MKVPHAYRNYAEAVIDAFWSRPIEKGGQPMTSKTQIRQLITSSIAQLQAADGDPATWTPCEHCDGSGIYTNEDRFDDSGTGTVADELRGLCYQCYGKGRQSEADHRRNWGYQKRQESHS